MLLDCSSKPYLYMVRNILSHPEFSDCSKQNYSIFFLNRGEWPRKMNSSGVVTSVDVSCHRRVIPNEHDLIYVPVHLADNWPLAGYIMKAFINLLNCLSRMVAETFELYSLTTFEPPILQEFESARCVTAG